MWALIPLKNLDFAKQRLAKSLSPQQRKALVMAMVTDELKTLSDSRFIEKIFIVSRDPYCHTLTEQLPVEILNLEADTDLNTGLTAATSLLSQQGCKDLMIIHGDLPLITTQDVNEFITDHQQSNAQVSLVSCQYKGGTNAMILSLPSDLTFHFGQDSFKQHQQNAAQKNLRMNTFYNQNPGTGFR